MHGALPGSVARAQRHREVGQPGAVHGARRRVLSDVRTSGHVHRRVSRVRIREQRRLADPERFRTAERRDLHLEDRHVARSRHDNWTMGAESPDDRLVADVRVAHARSVLL